MSKTDKTKPWRVRVAEHNPVAVHNHEHGICDLPPSPLDPGGALGVWTRGHCSWSDWNILYKDQCCYGCGCRMCTSYYYRKEDRRRDRHKGQRSTAQLRKEYYRGG